MSRTHDCDHDLALRAHTCTCTVNIKLKLRLAQAQPPRALMRQRLCDSTYHICDNTCVTTPLTPDPCGVRPLPCHVYVRAARCTNVALLCFLPCAPPACGEKPRESVCVSDESHVRSR